MKILKIIALIVLGGLIFFIGATVIFSVIYKDELKEIDAKIEAEYQKKKPLEWSIVNYEEDLAFNKKNITVVLDTLANKSELRDIAQIIRSRNASYDRLFIFYHVDTVITKHGCWATTHYTPDLEVEINDWHSSNTAN